jgi:hypothetical protein
LYALRTCVATCGGNPRIPYRVQSLHKGRDRQYRTYLIDSRPTEWMAGVGGQLC